MKEKLWRRRGWRSALACALALALAPGSCASAEARGDLEARFADVPRVELDGETWYLRGGLTLLLAAGLLPDAAGVLRADWLAAVAFDDDARALTALSIDPAAGIAWEDGWLRLGEIPVEGDGAAGMEELVAAVDELLGAELIGGYVGIDLEGAKRVPELSALEGGARERLHQLRLALEDLPSERLNEISGELGECLRTDLKGGEAARALDKAERYERREEVELPLLPEGEAGVALPDMEAAAALVAELFCERELF